MKTKRTIALAVLAASCAVLAPLRLAHADEPASSPGSGPAAGKDHFDRGMILYNVQDWPSAIRELRAAYEADPKSEYLFSLAQAQRLSGDCQAAILTYRSFMRQATGKASAAAEGLMHQCEAQVKAQQEAAPKVMAVPVPVAPAPGPSSSVAATPAPAPAPPTRNTTWIADPLGDTLAVLGIAGVAVGTVFFIQASSNRSNATSGLDSSWASDSSAAKTDSVVGAIGVGAGGLLLAGAIWRYVAIGARSKEQPPAPAVGLSFGHGGLQVSYGATF